MNVNELFKASPKEITIYGKWDHAELNNGSYLCYLTLAGY